ncbi:MAG: nitrilase-related carbon-nitrogen hydrolase [candidate division FCPU426 bacterium]
MPAFLSVSLLLIQALIAFLAFPNPILYRPNPVSALLLPLMGATYFIIFLAYRGRQVFVWSGLSVVAMVLLPTVHLVHMNFFPVTGVLIWLLVLALSFLLGGACGYLGSFIYRRLPWAFTLAAPAIICNQEFMRVLLAEHFSLVPPPSLLFAFPFAGLPPLIQMSAYTGYYGPAFLAFFISSLLALVALSLLGRLAWFRTHLPVTQNIPALAPGQRTLTVAVASGTVAVLFALFMLGNVDALRVSRLQDQARRTLRPALLQSQFDPSRAKDWSRPQQGFALRTYRDMSLEALAQGGQVLVFTENALPMTLPADEHAWQNLRTIFKEVGLPAFVGLTTTVEEEQVFNIWYLISAQGTVQDYYLKRYLTPFGEYLPLRSLVDPVMTGVNKLLRTSYRVLKITAIPRDYYDLRAGKQEKIFDVAGARVALKVCTETIIPRFFRQAVMQGADVILTPRTVNWFKTPVDWYLNLETSAFRAVETRRWIGVVANMGAAATIDALGAVRSETPYGKRVVAVPTLPLLDGLTFYARFGDVFAWLCVLLTLLLTVVAARRKTGA